jgi:hypothetical protein
MLHVDQIETALDPFDTLIQAVDPTVDAGEAFLDRRHPDLEVLEVLGHALRALVDPAQHD